MSQLTRVPGFKKEWDAIVSSGRLKVPASFRSLLISGCVGGRSGCRLESTVPEPELRRHAGGHCNFRRGGHGGHHLALPSHRHAAWAGGSSAADRQDGARRSDGCGLRVRSPETLALCPEGASPPRHLGSSLEGPSIGRRNQHLCIDPINEWNVSSSRKACTRMHS